ncbi:hypothetical protein D3C84_868440 [compost metagenome]
MGDDIGACRGHVDPNTDTAKTDLVAFQRVATTERGFNGADIGQVDAPCGIDDGSVAGEPERFVGEVGRENDGLSVIENAGIRIQKAHVGRCAGRTWNPGADGLGQAQVEGSTVGVLIPGGERAVGWKVRSGVDGIQRRLSDALGQSTHDQGGRSFGQ